MSKAIQEYVQMIQEQKAIEEAAEAEKQRLIAEENEKRQKTVNFSNISKDESDNEKDDDNEVKKKEEKPPKIMPKPVNATPHSLSNEEIREVFSYWVGQHCCYGRRVPQQMCIVKVENTSAYQYILESFCEHRATEWTKSPYRGTMYEPVDGVENGFEPAPWEIKNDPPVMFQDGFSKIEVPQTAFLKKCHKCNGEGKDACENCSGRGRVKCNMCDGTGRRTTEDRCNYCYGMGKRMCRTCEGEGNIECKVCQGCRSLRHFLSLNLTRKTFKNDYIDDTTNLPRDLVREAAGEIIFQDSDEIIIPINNFPLKSINDHAKLVFEENMEQISKLKCLMQRQTVRAVPVTTVHYTWNNSHHKFYIYGYKKHVYHLGRYPRWCCCCCAIL